METTLPEAENLDAQWLGDLEPLAETYSQAARDCGVIGVGTNAKSRAYLRLAEYCTIKARAMRHRAVGRIVQALNLEEKCDRIYRTLPDWARW